MSILQVEIGQNTGQISENFKQAEIFDPDSYEKPFHIKVTPGTPLYTKIVEVANDLDIKPVKAARILILGGWMGWRKFKPVRIEKEVSGEGSD